MWLFFKICIQCSSTCETGVVRPTFGMSVKMNCKKWPDPVCQLSKLLLAWMIIKLKCHLTVLPHNQFLTCALFNLF